MIPLMNEQDNVQPLVAEIYETLRGTLEFELLLVDDGSTDETVVRVQELLGLYPGLRLIRHEYRAGKSAAMRTAGQVARGEWLLMMDGDLQNDPADIPLLLAEMQRNPGIGMVAGNRRRRDASLSKRITSRLGNAIRRAVLRDSCPDTGCALKLIRRDLFLDLPYFDSQHRYLPALVRSRGEVYVNLPVNDRARIAGTSKYTNLSRAAVGLFDLMGVYWLLRRTHLPGIQAVEEAE
ncbi:glycosyltransferase family 2 protein [Niveispirillum sp. BGYR6]|uniref:glycosyltransferase family 2 protein n=1 Tax=Niveispirillum sp. BGYR6 TaxID=2971249 RepID=UPI0022B9B674|nr:glycosyltransferase family 2 protein [Niveispirillum sp. BGYR6]MDG5495119.1 glycosyltransferase family 2 protein [Niveispirillum sp. BGYR6]